MAGRVAVTGAGGKLGRAAVLDLRAHGWQVAAIDRAPVEPDLMPSTVADLTSFGEAHQALTATDRRWDGVDALVHLAAIPAPGMAPNATIFANNIVTSYNVFTAAIAAGVRTIIWASSETMTGIPYDVPPPCFPIDEDTPVRPETHYALGKHLEEQLAEQLCCWHEDLSMTGLRFSNVMLESDYPRFDSWQHDAALRRYNLWSYIDVRDGAQALRLALEHGVSARGLDKFLIASPDTVMRRPTAELLAEQFPGVEVRAGLPEHGSPLSTAKARRVLGFAPEHTWR